MALVTRMDEITMERNQVHEPVEATFCTFRTAEGTTYLQIDTYGSQRRQLRGKKSQSIQLSPEAIAQLREIISKL